MIFRLILMRHGEASYLGSDFDRPLSDAGPTQAGEVGDMLRSRGWIPDRVLFSDARRTTETWAEVKRHLPAPTGEWRAEARHALYLGGLSVVDGLLEELSEDTRTLLIIGHNPGLSEIASRYSGVHTGLGTACAALLTIDAERWSIASGMRRCWQLEGVLQPRW